MTTNIIEHGFDPDRKNQPISIRITIADGDLIMRIRDYCPKFDLTNQIRSIQDEKDPTKNIGIRLVEKDAKDVKYVNLLETNTLIITI